MDSPPEPPRALTDGQRAFADAVGRALAKAWSCRAAKAIAPGTEPSTPDPVTPPSTPPVPPPG